MIMQTHKCQCGKHDFPGRIVLRLGKLILVRVDAPNGIFWELRKLSGSIEPMQVHSEDLIKYWRYD